MSKHGSVGIGAFRNELTQLVNRHISNGTSPDKIVDSLNTQIDHTKVKANTEGRYSNNHKQY